MNERIIKVERTSDPLYSLKIGIYEPGIHPSPIQSLQLTPEEACELESILGLFRYNNFISSLTGSVGGLRAATFGPEKKA